MPSNSSKKTQPAPVKKQASAPRRASTEVQPISPLGVIGAIAVALAIAGVLLFVINTRISGSRPAAPTPTTAPVIIANTPATSAPANTPTTASAVPGVTQIGGFSKGDPNAKVTVTEFSDFK